MSTGATSSPSLRIGVLRRWRNIPPPAARVGDTYSLVSTPSLLIDLDVFDSNVREMAAFANAHRVARRPHAKAHKSSAIARPEPRLLHPSHSSRRSLVRFDELDDLVVIAFEV